MKKILSIQKGFTLVELLVVIAIIGILSSLLVANFIGVRQRGRDAQRKSNLRQIQSAVELYRADQAGYPTTLPACGQAFTSTDGKATYMQKVPCDPSGAFYSYTSSDTTKYILIGCLENPNDSDIDKDNNGAKINCTGSTTLWQYTLKNP